MNRYPTWWAVRSPALQAGLSGGNASWCGNLKRVRPLVARICHCSTELTQELTSGLVLGGKFLLRVRRTWEEGDPSWGKPIGQKAGKDPSVTFSTKFVEHLLCARQRVGLPGPVLTKTGPALQGAHTVPGSWAGCGPTLCQFLSPGLLTAILGGENYCPHFTGEAAEDRGPPAIRGRARFPFSGLDDSTAAHHMRFVQSPCASGQVLWEMGL